MIAAGAAAIRGRGRPDRWVPPVGMREREGGGGDGAGLRGGGKMGRGWAVRPVSASLTVFYFFLTATFFQFLLFQMEFKTTPKTLTKI